MAVQLDGAEMWKLNEYDIVRLDNFHASGEYYPYSDNKNMEQGTILQGQNIPSR
jgi:hypothetical protein